VFDFADEIDEGALGSSALGQSKFTSGNLDDNRDEVFGAIELKVIDLHCDGKLRDGIVEHERVFELAFFVDCGKAAEQFIRIVTLAVGEVRGGIVGEGNFNAAESAVLNFVAS